MSAWLVSPTHRPTAFAASLASTPTRRAARSDGSACRGEPFSRSSSFSHNSTRSRSRGIASVSRTSRSTCVTRSGGTDYLVSKGVECVSKPERSPRGHTFFFAKDCDGNLIELMDLGYMHYVLGWLGPLGGLLFRHGMLQALLPVASIGGESRCQHPRVGVWELSVGLGLSCAAWCRPALSRTGSRSIPMTSAGRNE